MDRGKNTKKQSPTERIHQVLEEEEAGKGAGHGA